MKNKFLFTGGLIAIAMLIKPKKASSMSLLNDKIQPITKDHDPRECDAYGCGHFGASRGSRKHNGLDVTTIKGQKIFSPITGYLNRLAYPYRSDLSYKGIEIIGEGIHKDFRVKIFYCTPTVAVKTRLKAGQQVAISQKINDKYSDKMKNHVHLELYYKGKLVDPDKFLNN